MEVIVVATDSISQLPHVMAHFFRTLPFLHFPVFRSQYSSLAEFTQVELGVGGDAGAGVGAGASHAPHVFKHFSRKLLESVPERMATSPPSHLCTFARQYSGSSLSTHVSEVVVGVVVGHKPQVCLHFFANFFEDLQLPTLSLQYSASALSPHLWKSAWDESQA